MPLIGSIISGIVTKTTPQYATVSIMMIHHPVHGSLPIPAASATNHVYTGMIRLHDIRAFQKDQLEMSKCFRPGDVVKCEVISLGDAKSYYLMTSRNELGVVYAKSAAGDAMIPISWQQMQCPNTKSIEFRKVAKVE